MYTALYSLFFLLRRLQIKNPDNSICSRLIGYIEAYYNLRIVKKYLMKESKEYGVTRRKRKQRVIVSFTSYPKRIDKVWIVAETLLRQSVKADEVILWLAKSQFPTEDSVPLSLKKLQERGLTIRFCDDLRSHKKYFYVMQEYPEDLIILADDDLFYPLDMIEKLLILHKDNPEDIVCMTPQIISPGFDSYPSEWRHPKLDEKISHSYYAQAYSGAGTLFPPHAIPKEAFQENLIFKLCPYADDLWLKFMSLKTATKTTAIYPFRSIPVSIYGTGESSLWYINGQGGQNDEQWKKIIERFPKEFESFKNLE